MSYQHLAIGGGGMKGYIAVGALQSINNNYNLNKFKSYIGISVGSLLCFFLSKKAGFATDLTNFMYWVNKFICEKNVFP